MGDHPNVLPIHDLGEENGQPYLILPLMAGGDLDHLMDNAKDRRLSMELTIAIAKEVCLGLEYAHSRGMVQHR
ncbi:MAG: protein kinase [Chloroflexi bacterium]|nr:protein kinase [Chloroflexota bacterium]